MKLGLPRKSSRSIFAIFNTILIHLLDCSINVNILVFWYLPNVSLFYLLDLMSNYQVWEINQTYSEWVTWSIVHSLWTSLLISWCLLGTGYYDGNLYLNVWQERKWQVLHHHVTGAISFLHNYVVIIKAWLRDALIKIMRVMVVRYFYKNCLVFALSLKITNMLIIKIWML